jgi:hypothetical protein
MCAMKTLRLRVQMQIKNPAYQARQHVVLAKKGLKMMKTAA